MATALEPIPSPPGLPFVGHAFSVDQELPARTFASWARAYGPVYKISMMGRSLYWCSSRKVINELCDEKRFAKKVAGPLEQVRVGAGPALFTAYHGEEEWGIGHRILMPAFGPGQIRDMFPDMLDINAQLVLKWERFGPDYAIDPTEDFTRLAFDTISLCSMSYRFNSFYRNDFHPFIDAMVRFLVESGYRSRRPQIVQAWMTNANAQFEADLKTLTDTTDEIIEYRKTHQSDRKDLLALMLTGVDPKTGRGLSDVLIRQELITFLVAGHETTSGLLSFTMYHLLSNPRAYAVLQREVDTVVGKDQLTLAHIPKLEYIQASLRESLRLDPPAGAFNLFPLEDTVLQGKWAVKKGDSLIADLRSLHRDPEVWGDDAEEFRPERMLDGKFEALPPNAWKPFGNGARACIGRAFAWQEAIMMLATLFQRFDFRFADPSYKLQLKSTLTTKPLGLSIYAIPRRGAKSVAELLSGGSGAVTPARQEREHAHLKQESLSTAKGVPLHVYFGSNTGSCEGFAQSVAGDALGKGFNAKIATLDSIEGKFPTDGPVVILTASYEGQPADNAAHFVEWLNGLKGTALQNVQYAVFGAGHHDWARTYQAVPTLIDDTMAERGATRLMARFAADAGGPDLFGEFDKWEAELWPVLQKKFGTASVPTAPAQDDDDLVVTVTGTARSVRLRQPDLSLGHVVANKVLTAPGVPQKRHIEFQLPESMTYRPGDYLAILPVNPPETVRRVLKRFELLPDTKVAIKSKGPTTLPTDEPISVQELLSEYVELSQPATKRNLDDLAVYAPKDASEAKKFQDLVANAKTAVLDKRVSVLDILELFPSISIPLSAFIKMLPSMRIRQYSISSSPLAKPDHCSVTVSVIKAPALAGLGGDFYGVASNYLANLQRGDTVQIAVRSSAAKFHLPADCETPIIMFCAGSGFAPMRGFIEDRAEQIRAGRKVGRAILFVGCRAPEEDFLYATEELAHWIELGAVDVHPTFSKFPEASLGCKYVQDRVWKERDVIKSAFNDGGRMYVCGMTPMSNALRDKCIAMIREELGCDEEKAQRAFQKIATERYSTDVFG